MVCHFRQLYFHQALLSSSWCVLCIVKILKSWFYYLSLDITHLFEIISLTQALSLFIHRCPLYEFFLFMEHHLGEVQPSTHALHHYMFWDFPYTFYHFALLESERRRSAFLQDDVTKWRHWAFIAVSALLFQTLSNFLPFSLFLLRNCLYFILVFMIIISLWLCEWIFTKF